MARRIEFVALDLDVIADGSLRYFERDGDTFARNRVAMGYTLEAMEAARRGVALAIRLIEAREYPFDGSPEALLGRVLAAQGTV